MTRKKVQKIKIPEPLSAEKYVGVILENVNSKFDQVLEGNAALSQGFKGFRNEFNGFRNEANFKFGIITDGFKGFRNEFKGFRNETKITLQQIREYLSRIDDEIQDIKIGLEQKADLKYVQQLEARVVRVELAVQKYLQ